MSLKPPIPAVEHPRFLTNVKMALEFLMGRRGQRVAKLYENNRAITQTISSPPTQAEVTALRDAINALAGDVRENRRKINEILEHGQGPYES